MPRLVRLSATGPIKIEPNGPRAVFVYDDERRAIVETRADGPPAG